MSAPVAAVPRVARLLLAAAAVVPLLAGCGPDQAMPTPTVSTASDLAAVRVVGEDGKQPTVTFPVPFAVQHTSKKVLRPGTGPAVKQGQRVTIDYVGLNGADGKEFDHSYGRKPTNFVLDPSNALNMKGLQDGLVGVAVGSRLVLAIPSTEAYGVKGVPAQSIGPTDTLVVVVDIEAASDVLARATGKAVPAKTGLPTVTLDAKGRPTITLPKADPPANLIVQPLIQGTGKPVEKGQDITVQYTGVLWPGGRVFDSSWSRPGPGFFAVGAGRLLAGWDDGLVGQPVGSQILLVVPPDKGYGATGNAALGIKGTDTLVFVVDLLDAA